jgi:anti-anti-sigma regulatory factor
MLTLQMDKIGDLAVVECEGSIARATDAERLRDAVLSQDWARVIMIDLSAVEYLEMDGVEVLAFLRGWARESDIQLKLFNPSSFVRHQFETVDETFHFEFSSLQEAMNLLIRADAAIGWPATDAELKHAA